MASTRSEQRVSYSPSEVSLLKLLPDDGRRVSSEELTRHHYRGERSRPFHARKAVVAVMSSLIVKVKQNREPFIIKRTDRSGPHPIQFWKEKRR